MVLLLIFLRQNTCRPRTRHMSGHGTPAPHAHCLLQIYARGPRGPPSEVEQVEQLVAMGFGRPEATAALRRMRNMDLALAYLLRQREEQEQQQQQQGGQGQGVGAGQEVQGQGGEVGRAGGEGRQQGSRERGAGEAEATEGSGQAVGAGGREEGRADGGQREGEEDEEVDEEDEEEDEEDEEDEDEDIDDDDDFTGGWRRGEARRGEEGGQGRGGQGRGAPSHRRRLLAASRVQHAMFTDACTRCVLRGGPPLPSWGLPAALPLSCTLSVRSCASLQTSLRCRDVLGRLVMRRPLYIAGDRTRHVSLTRRAQCHVSQATARTCPP